MVRLMLLPAHTAPPHDQQMGGAVAVGMWGSATITECTFDGNTAPDVSGLVVK
jgi:hypothetical protein